MLRLGAFMLTAVLMAALEIARPRRRPDPDRMGRWVGNLGVVAVSTALARLVFPVVPMALAASLRGLGLGIFPALDLPLAAEIVLGILILDLAMYGQHRLFHAWRPLWRLHRMHHADTFFDFSTGVRFHPLEILISMAFKLALVTLLAPPPLAVLAFEIILNSAAMFNHANFFLPLPLDRILRLALVTPDMHRIHHSTDGREMNRNFGFSFPWWDRIFSSYQDQPAKGHENMPLGLNIFRDTRCRSLLQMLAMPFVNPKSEQKR
ncbi:Sterol desaturase/sphingolipid hydroxylase, fatty acid hydroxylase superfamily [Desulfomicrobium norvegicum]|uniref:Sterol desaturase/sphingolipid hydroxylase, fatty acid hydroxylase superfamily n=2 Tax=Desulfomicrobium TaxID=898 RepID=A0A8G2C3W5_DESNO|nr:Sterol desaturase/sphingolipid hydroxylase, fatty acid hydroxylase superfamily [Desulfomicrobium norvegicum]